jgi:predicted O-linked N-acetylglucosamine transferase (SPINDLY family)
MTASAEPIGALWGQLRHAPARASLWRQLSQAYADAGLLPQRAYAARQQRRIQSTPADFDPEPTPLAAGSPGAEAGSALLLQPGAGAAQEWAEALARWLETCPGDWLSWLYLARLNDGRAAVPPSGEPAAPGGGDPAAEASRDGRDNPRQAEASTKPSTDPSLSSGAGDALQRARALEPIAGESLHWLGVWRLNGGDHQRAIEALGPLVDLRPLRHGSMLYLGEALLRAGNRTAAEVAFTRASASTNPAFLRLLAQRVYQHNYWQEAIAVLQRAQELVPDQRETLLALAQLHWEVYDLSTAEALCRRILQLDPDNGEVRYLLNALPGRRGDAAAHLAAVESHYSALNDPRSRLASSIAMASLYVDALSPEQVAERHRRLCQPIEAAVTPTTTFANDRDPGRALRIGLVSGDFHRQHPVNLFMLPLLERLDQQRFPTTVFHTGTMHDEDTVRARRAAVRWIEAGQLDDPALHRCIRDQQIDLLIDLAGHTSSHRLGVFAMRAAPVQATFLGYPHSTGLSRIDWLIGDPVVSPANRGHLFSEGIAQLPGSVFCWCPVDAYPLPPPRPPEAPLVLGSFNNIMKLSPRTIRLWGAVLRDLPEAQLLLKAPSLGDDSVIERFIALFAAVGIGSERLAFEGPSELGQMMQRYGAIDIALDPTPYNGGTTSLQALWMGVPVITLAGGNFVGRMGASFLTALGRSAWIAHSAAQYRAIAGDLAAQLPELRRQRAALRQQMASSGLADLDRYTQHVQQLLRRIWQHHCSGSSERLLAASRGDPPCP